ncbi:hypothetical protein TWF730_006902 [Orbilia blumenaviensis]|uniref:Transposase n=1 Tax=Orbilia blumenaviensis TaxID=1796055 RepID=A0AAV9VFM3_9PEZI
MVKTFIRVNFQKFLATFCQDLKISTKTAKISKIPYKFLVVVICYSIATIKQPLKN